MEEIRRPFTIQKLRIDRPNPCDLFFSTVLKVIRARGLWLRSTAAVA